jgi:hypothetical protein
MGVDCKLVLKATVTPAAGKRLAAFCRDWHQLEYLPEAEKKSLETPFAETFECCESLFQNHFDPASLKALEGGRLEIQYVGGFDTDAVETLENVLLPRILRKLETFQYDIPEFGTRVVVAFDEDTRTLSKTRLAAPEADDADLDGSWEEEYGALSREEWRANLAEFLDLVADPELQQEVLVEKSSEHDFDPPFTDFEIWFDLNAYYIGRLNLDAGLDWAESEGFLSADEKDRIAAFDRAFRSYLPDNMGSTDARPILETKEWQNIVRLARGLAKLFR